MRGYIKEINGDLCWHDAKDQPHKITCMEESYINNCITLLEPRLIVEEVVNEDGIDFKELKRYEQRQKTSKQAQKDIDLFKAELARREAVNSTKVGQLLFK